MSCGFRDLGEPRTTTGVLGFSEEYQNDKKTHKSTLIEPCMAVVPKIAKTKRTPNEARKARCE